MARRVEGQFIRDCHFGYVAWNCAFKAILNLSKSLLSYDYVMDGDKRIKTTAHDIQVAAISL
eukprot:794837-Karenia_brevis.AAC.1